MRLVDEVNGGDSGLLPAILHTHLSSGVGTIDPFEQYNDSDSLCSYSYSSKIFIPNVTKIRQMLTGRDKHTAIVFSHQMREAG